jgi:hypothetical protein
MSPEFQIFPCSDRYSTICVKKKMPDKQRQLKNQMIAGAGVMLFGLLCPFFWWSLVSGTSGYETLVYGVHTAVFITIGLAITGKGWYDLIRIQRDDQ